MITLYRKGEQFIGCVDWLIPRIFNRCEEGFYLSYPMSFREALVLYKLFGRDFITKVYYEKFLGRYVSEKPEKHELKEALQVIQQSMANSVDFLAELAGSEVYRSGLERIRRKPYRLMSTPIPIKSKSLFFPNSVTILLEPPEVSESALRALLKGKISLEPFYLGKEMAYVPREAFFGSFNNPLAKISVAIQTVGMSIPEAREYVLEHVMPYVFTLLALSTSRRIVRGK